MKGLKGNGAGPSELLQQLRGGPASLRYITAIGLVGTAFLARLSLDGFLGQDAHPYATFYIAVTVAEFLLGLGPALAVMCLGLLASLWFIVPPRDALVVRGYSDIVEIFLYFFVTGTIVFVMEKLQKARQEATESALLAEARQKEIEHAREQLEKLVDERTARLRKSVEELEHFSYALTHDMRAPLRAMRSYAELVREESPKLSVQAQEYCGRIMTAAERMDLLICDSLNYTKVIRENLPLQPVHLPSFLQGLVDTYPNLQKNQKNIHISADLPSVLANGAGLAQCFSNLLGNAIKFAQPGRALQIRISAENHQGRVRIKIEDNGVGIPRHAQHRLFGMFQRLNNEHEGTGIGLAIVRKVVERMGGTVGAASEPGEGSCFWFELPAAPANLNEGSPPATRPVKRSNEELQGASAKSYSLAHL